MDIFKNASAMVTRSLRPKRNKKTRKNSPRKSYSSKYSSRESSGYRSSLSGSPGTKKEKLSIKIGKKLKKWGLDSKSIAQLDKSITELDDMKSVFTKSRKRVTSSSSKSKSQPSSPVVLTLKNLDTGKKEEATVVKNLNTGKYEFIGLR
jgi:hypothetical protein